jgi:hypothetical protein
MNFSRLYERHSKLAVPKEMFMTKTTIKRLAGANFCVAMLAASLLTYSTPGRAQSTLSPPDAATVQKGLDLAPVPLNLTGKDKNQVCYGSYLVNAVADCNGCHSTAYYTEDGDPYMGKPKKVDTSLYLAGGFAFGPFISRNLTPNAAGQIAGGGLENFKQTIRTGLDLRKLHPELGPLLQVMPWPVFNNMFDRELDAIFAYLTAVPCLEGGPGELPNRCKPAVQTAAVASPKNFTAVAREVQLDGTKSTAADGKALKYLWTIPPGSPSAAIRQGDTATPTVQFGTIRGTYTFQLTVTDSTGKTSTDTVTINFAGV